jgi:YVTN family beta-propeller protein
LLDLTRNVVSPDGTRVYVTDNDFNTVTVIDTVRQLPTDVTAAALKQECFSAVGIEVDGRRGVVDLRIAW